MNEIPAVLFIDAIEFKNDEAFPVTPTAGEVPIPDLLLD